VTLADGVVRAAFAELISIPARSADGLMRKANVLSDADIPFRGHALAQLHKRRAKLVREVEMIEATIAGFSRS
jgi:hypothetical protein